MDHLPRFKIDLLRQWLVQEGIPDYCANRTAKFVTHHEQGNYEESTYLGIPLIDEIAHYFYKGKTFTTKRRNRKGDQSKPDIAMKSEGAPEIGNYAKAFVQAFGSLQEDFDHTRRSDEDYWNRHAIGAASVAFSGPTRERATVVAAAVWPAQVAQLLETGFF